MDLLGKACRQYRAAVGIRLKVPGMISTKRIRLMIVWYALEVDFP
jgi:hypothetical protein